MRRGWHDYKKKVYSLSRNVASEENVDANKLILIDDLSSVKNNGVKLSCRQIRFNYTKSFFANNIIGEWNKLPPPVVKCITIDFLKTNLITISSNKVSDKAYLTRRTV